MSHHKPTLPTAERVTGTGPLRTGLLGVGAALVLLSLACYLILPDLHKQISFSYLFAFIYFFTIVGGAFFWTVLHHAVDADWSVVVRRQLENIISSWWVLAVLFLPLILMRENLWLWMVNRETDPMVNLKSPYLTLWFAGLRAALIFGMVGFWAYLLCKNSSEQDKTGHPAFTIRNRYLSISGIPIIALSISFAGIDWLMGLDYHWYSTMWGVYIFAGSVQSSLATLIITCFVLKKLGYLKVVNSEHFHVMGKFLLAFTIFWAYVAFSQYMLIWYANIPEETNWFVKRNNGLWTYVAMLLTTGHFIFPFIFLLPQWLKQNSFTLTMISTWILIMHAVDHYWIVMPNYHKDLTPSIFDVTFFIGIGSLMLSQVIASIGSTNTVPIRDPRIFESMKLKN